MHGSEPKGCNSISETLLGSIPIPTRQNYYETGIFNPNINSVWRSFSVSQTVGNDCWGLENDVEQRLFNDWKEVNCACETTREILGSFVELLLDSKSLMNFPLKSISTRIYFSGLFSFHRKNFSFPPIPNLPFFVDPVWFPWERLFRLGEVRSGSLWRYSVWNEVARKKTRKFDE